MGATFDPRLSRPLDFVRVRIADNAIGSAPTDAGPQAVVSPAATDETIIALIASSQEPEPYNETCVTLAEGFVAKFSGMPDEIDQQNVVTVSWKMRVEGWLKLLEIFRTTPARVSTAGRSTGVGNGQMTRPDFRGYRH